MWLLRRRFQETYPLYAFAVLYSLSVIAFYVLGRFRIPWFPPCACSRGWRRGAIEAIRNSRLRSAAFLLFFIAVAVVSWRRPADPLRPQDYFNLVRFHVIKGETGEADRWLGRWKESIGKRPDRDSAETFYLQSLAAFTGGRTSLRSGPRSKGP